MAPVAVSYKVIGRHIREARQLKDLTQEDLADKLGMSSTHLGKLERGERNINLERLGQISLLLEVPLETLVAGAVTENIAAETNLPSQNNAAFLQSMEQLTKGCSAKSLNLMLRLCREVVREEQ